MLKSFEMKKSARYYATVTRLRQKAQAEGSWASIIQAGLPVWSFPLAFSILWRAALLLPGNLES